MNRPLSRTWPLTLVAGLLTALVIPGSATAQEAAGNELVWTSTLSMQYNQVSGTEISPNGDRVAWVVREPLMEGEQSEYLSHIWVADADGSNALQYTRGEKSATSPTFSPDGLSLAFTSGRSGSNEIWMIPLGGGEAWQVTDTESGVGSFEFSPDGRQIAFTMDDPETEEEKTAKKEKRDVILVDQDFKYSHLYVVAIPEDQSEPAEEERITEGAFHVTGFDWAPDGIGLAFAHQPDPRINTARLEADLSWVTLGDKQVRHLVTTGGTESSPLISPDGAWIAYLSSGAQAEPVGLDDIYVIAVAGGEPRALEHTPDRSPQLLDWTQDGSALLFSESIGTTRQILRLPVDGGAPTQVSDVQGVIGGAALAANSDRMAFTYQTTDEPADVYVSAASRFEPQQITEMHKDVPRPAMGRTELLTWTAPDGLKIEGLLTYPVGYREGDRVPLILNVHGGPAGVFSQSFTGSPSIYMLQTFAQEGFAILRPNPRGSMGYGKDFRYANVMDWGYGDYDDLMSGVDHVIDLGVGDPDQLYLMGWSYGGYMTSFAVTRTDRFKAASMGAGLPNLISMVTTTDIQEYLAAHMGGEFWDDYETYEKHSAMYRIANVVTPTQVIHGAEDLRVPFTQGQEFYRALGRRGVPTEMVVYPRTPHGPREPKFLMDVTDRILAWFRTHESARPRAF